MSRPIEGVLPILHTPFSDDEMIDRDSLAREVDWVFQIGAGGVCTAMVSELLRLTAEERVELTHTMAELAAGRGVVVASIGAESTKQTLAFGAEAVRAGCDAVMAAPPVATALAEDVLLDHFRAIAEAIDLPLIVQDASSYVGQPLSTAFYATLLEAYGPEKILFKPEGDPIGPNLSALRDATGGRARAFDGSGGILLVDAFRRGIVGTMPGVDLLDGIVALWRALQAGDEDRAYQLYFPICAIVALQLQAGLDGFLAIEKYILVKRGLFTSARRRAPHGWELDDETRAEVDRLLAHLTAVIASADSISRPGAP